MFEIVGFSFAKQTSDSIACRCVHLAYRLAESRIEMWRLLIVFLSIDLCKFLES